MKCLTSAGRNDQANLTNSPETYEGEPSWSPNGKRIAFHRFDPELEQLDVWVMDADGSNQVNLTPGPEDGYQPAWAPDGKRIAYITKRSSQPDQSWCEGGCLGYSEIYVMDADGSNPVNLTNDPQTYAEHPDWRATSGGASGLPWLVGGGAAIVLVGAAVLAIRRRARAGSS